METKDTLLEAFKSAAEKQKPTAFHGMEDVWQQIEARLDEKEETKIIPIWKKWSVAAAVLVLLGVGGFIWINKKSDKNTIVKNNIIKTDPQKANTIIRDSTTSVAVINDNIAKTSTKNKTHLKLANNEKTKIKHQPNILSDVIEKKEEIVASNKPSLRADSLFVSSQLSTNNMNEITVVSSPNRQMKRSMSASAVAIPNQQRSTNMDEVVVIGYGTQKKKDITGAIAMAPSPAIPINQYNRISTKGTKNVNDASTINNSLGFTASTPSCCLELRDKLGLQKNYSQNNQESIVVNALQGKIAGLAIGTPGASTQIVIRGNNSLSNNQEPLFIIDGISIKSEDLNKINTNDIKDVKVLKDASATAIYGSRGANGVVLITTNHAVTLPFEPENESYETYKENSFASPIATPYSTFSIDVDNASYTNIRRFINNGQQVPKDAVRIEEMINFFKYHTPQPKNNDPFTIHTEYGVAPWNPQHNILKVSLQAKTIPPQALPASNMVFLIDVSGSMDQPNKLPLLQASMKLLVSKLRPQDKVSIVTYAGNAGLVLAATSGAKKDTIIKAIENLIPNGGTAGGAGIELAYKIAKEQFVSDGNNRVILATDGDFNVGVSSDSELEDLISEKRKSHIFLTCLGFGMGNYKDSKMQILAQKGNGNYAYIDNIQEANRVLVKEFGGTMFTVAKDVKIQMEFNPSKVKAYRLIGYETRLLKDEDFANDKIDAGEMGSGHTVTALYEIIPSNIKSDSLFQEVATPRYAQPQTNSHGNELAFIKTRYKDPMGEKSTEQTSPISTIVESNTSVSPDYRLATTVAWFGLKLRNSKLVPDKTTKDILLWGMASNYDDPDGYIAELFRLIETQP